MRLTVAGGLILLVVALAAFASGAENPRVDLAAPPSTLTADRPWSARMTVTRHGRPLSLVRPELVIRRGSEKHSFVAHPAGADGHYRAYVTFPRFGVWRYGVRLGADYVNGGTVSIHSGPAQRMFAPPGGP